MASSRLLGHRINRDHKRVAARPRKVTKQPLGLEGLEARIVLSEFLQVNSVPINVTTGPAAPVLIPVISFYAPGIDTNNLRVSVDYGNGDVTKPNFVVQTTSPSYYLLSAENAYQAAGNYTATVTVADMSNGDSATVSDPATVTNPPVGTIGNIIATAGTPFQNLSTTSGGTLLQQSVIDFPGNGDAAANYSATINWGDGTGITGSTITGPIILNGQSTYIVNGTHTYSTPGTYTGTVTVQGPITQPFADGSMYTYSFQATSSFLIPSAFAAFPLLETTAGDPAPAELQVATFGAASAITPNVPNPDSNFYSASIDWGDGTAPSAGLITSSGSNLTVESSGHTYAAPGDYQIKVTLSDAGDPNLSSALATAYVTAPTGTPVAASGVAGAPLAASGLTVPLETLTVQTPTLNSDTKPEVVPLASGYYSATIDWGDGSPENAGIITDNYDYSLFNPTVSSLTVSGPDHTYASPGTYPVSILLGTTGQPNLAVYHTTITVAPPIVPTSLALNPASDTGVSNSDGITNDVTPNFTGTAAPGSTVVIDALVGQTIVPIGQGVAGASGAYSITSIPLANGRFTVTAVATPAGGNSSDAIESASIPLVIDTVGPKIVGFRVTNAAKGQFTVTFEDDLSGLVESQLVDGTNYDVQRTSPQPRPGQDFIVSTLTTSPLSTPTTPVTVTGTVFNGHYVVLRGGVFVFTIDAAGITDVAGNALDGEFYGKFPTGNGHPGGNFKAQVVIKGYTPSGPTPFTTASPSQPGAAQVSPQALAPKLKRPGLNAPPVAPIVKVKATAEAKPKHVAVKSHKA